MASLIKKSKMVCGKKKNRKNKQIEKDMQYKRRSQFKSVNGKISFQCEYVMLGRSL